MPVCLDVNKTSAISGEAKGVSFSFSPSKAKRTNWAIFISALSSRMRGARFFHSRLARLLPNDVCVRLRRYRDPRPFLGLHYDLGLQNRYSP